MVGSLLGILYDILSSFDFINNYDTGLFWAFYVLNVIFAVIAFKLGFARELPLLKSIIVYIMLLIGTFILTIFSILKYPMTETLVIISIVLGIYRFRLHRERQARKQE